MQTSRTDSQLKADVQAELAWDSHLDGAEVGVAVDHGVVTLTGRVASWPTRLAARDAAHRVMGVRDVADELTVIPPAERGRPTDTAIARAVRQALTWHAFVDAPAIASTVSQGIVTLTGKIASGAARADAEHAVQEIAGVCGVRNELVVAPPDVSAVALRQSIQMALDRRAWREGRHLALDIEGGTVTVSGPVESLAERVAVLGAVRGTRGVATVVDHLHVV